MDQARVGFLFGDDIPRGFDLQDPEERSVALSESADPAWSSAPDPVREVLATQILEGDPPEVWATARRLLDSGLARDDVLEQLVLALLVTVKEMKEATAVDPEATYRERLAELPVPSAAALASALYEIVKERPGIDVDEAEALALSQAGASSGDRLAELLLDRVSDLVIDEGPLELLVGDRYVHVEAVVDGSVFTHRLTEWELGGQAIDGSADLAGFARYGEVALDSGEPIDVHRGRHTLTWTGPDRWLATFSPGDCVAIRVIDGVASIAPVTPPPVDTDLVQRLYRIYEDEVAEPGLSVPISDLVLGLLVEDRATFAEPTAPLSELCAAADLEVREDAVAHDEEIWRNDRINARIAYIVDAFLHDEDAQDAAMTTLKVLDEPSPDDELVRNAMSALHDPDVLNVFTDALFGTQDDPDFLEDAREFSERLLAVAKRGEHVAVARWFGALVAERSGEVHVADAHLALALEADPTWEPAVDRAAWYAFDKGDAPGAATLWRRLPLDERPSSLLEMAEQMMGSAGAKLGRNDRCWCGSGRKYKACHLGRYEPPALPDRVGWLCMKAAAYLNRRGSRGRLEIAEMAFERAIDPEDRESVADAFEDPIVVDTVLLEGGWFEGFVAERGPLLPDDEALLAGAWTLVNRTIYEVLETRPGEAMVLQDLGTGDRVDVRERTASRWAKRGQVICARAVPDGVSHQLIGAVFPVTPGTETEVLSLCDERDGAGLCAYVARLHRPPTLQTREAEPFVDCTAVVALSDANAATGVLDDLYQREGEGRWFEVHELHDDDSIVRANLVLDGDRLTISTNSEPRLERVLTTLDGAFPAMKVVSDERSPVSFPTMLRGQDNAPEHLDLPADVAEEIQDKMERRWLTEHVPALGGLTPVEAVADPSRVEQVERLIASWAQKPLPAGSISIRPDRVRQLLGLPVPEPE